MSGIKFSHTTEVLNESECLVNYVLLRSSRQSSLLRSLWVMPPVTRTEYGQASSDSRPLISSWKLSASLGPAMDASTPNMSLHTNLHTHHMFNNYYGKLRNSKSSLLCGVFSLLLPFLCLTVCGMNILLQLAVQLELRDNPGTELGVLWRSCASHNSTLQSTIL